MFSSASIAFPWREPRRRFLHLLGFAVFLLDALQLPAETKPGPNVILIMADDLGYGDLSCFKGEKMRTPVLDKLAADGARFTNFYSGGTVCTPSRMALMTGRYPSRIGWTGGVMGHKMSPSTGLSSSIRTMAEVFKTAGYQTAISGKWHLGEAPEMLPNARGFNESLCILSSNNQTKKLWRNGELVTDAVDNRLLTEHFTREAIRVIQAKDHRPFFLYLPFTAPHFPAEAHPDLKGKSTNGAYGDVVEELDSRIGEILSALKESGQRENTLVFFLSDNGPEPSQKGFNSAGPLRGRKWSSMEGGTRVPGIVAWPGTIPAGQTIDDMVCAIDIFPTLARACGVSMAHVAAEIPMDGVDVWPSFLGKENGPPHARTQLLYWEGWAEPQAIRIGQWKLFFDEVKDIPGSESGPALFDLEANPDESHNLAAEHPEKVKEMLEAARKSLENIREFSLPMGGLPKESPAPATKSPRWL
ncbi:MAG: sulfatase-like hydrolase/transferase [Verrucomicrobiales bacterium]